MKYSSKKFSIIVLFIVLLFSFSLLVFDRYGNIFQYFSFNTIASESIPLVEKNGDLYEQSFSGGYYIDYELVDNKAIVKNFRSQGDTKKVNLIIPNSVVTKENEFYDVVEIAAGAFKGANVINIELGNNIEIIRKEAFKNNKSIESIAFDIYQSKLLVIEESAFENTQIKHFGDINYKGYIFPNSLEKIEKRAFAEVNNVNTIKFNNALKYIDEEAFINSQVHVVNFGLSIKEIGDNAFNTDYLRYVYFPGDAPLFGKSVFRNDYVEVSEGEIKRTENFVKIYYEITCSSWDPDYAYLTSEGKYAVLYEPDTELAFYQICSSDFNILEFKDYSYEEGNEPVDGYLSSDYQGIVYRFNTLNRDSIDLVADVYSFADVKLTEVFIPNEVIYDNIIYKVNPIRKIDGVDGVNNTLEKIILGKEISKVESGAFDNLTKLHILCSLSNELTLGDSIFADSIEKFEIIASNPKFTDDSYRNFIYDHNVLDKNWIDNNGIFYTVDGEYAVVGDLKDDENANTSKFKGTDAVIPDYVSIEKKFFKVVGISRYAFYNNQFLERIDINAFIAPYKAMENNSIEPLPVIGNGTKTNPFTLSQIIDEGNKLSEGQVSAMEYYTIGEISVIDEYDSSFGAITFKIKEDADEVECYLTKYLNGEKFTSSDQIKVGDGVVICGRLTKIDGKVKFVENSYIDSTIVKKPGIYDCSLRNCPSLVQFKVDARNEKYCSMNSECIVKDNYNQFLAEKQKSGEKYYPNKVVKAGIDVTKFEANNQYMETIENYAFANCYKLTELVLNKVVNGVEYKIVKIGEHAFENTPIGFNGANILDFSKVEELGDYAFANCYYIKEVLNLSDFDKLRKYGNFVFQNCYNIDTITTQPSNEFLVAEKNILYSKQYENNGTDYYYVLSLYAPKNKALSELVNKNDQFIVDKFYDIPVKRIDAYAFAYSNLTNVVIGDSVNIIGKAAFANSNKLHNIKIGKKVFYIGLEILPKKTKDKVINYNDVLVLNDDLTRNEDIYIYEQEVFNNCYSLVNIEVDDKNLFYMADGNGILFNKDKTTLLYYPQGISRTTYTVPYSVTKISMEAFENNTHLARLIVSENVSEIGAKAFNGCTNLVWIYFRSLEAPIIGEQVFNSTGALGGGLTIYCIPQPSIWYEELENQWSNLYIEKYNSIQEVPNESVTADLVYTVYVTDSDGNGLSGMNITLTYLNDKQRFTVTDGEGYAVFTVPNQDALFNKKYVKLEIKDPNNKYSSFIEERFELDFSTTFSYIILYAEPIIEGVKYAESYYDEVLKREVYERILSLQNEIIYVNKFALTSYAMSRKEYMEDSEIIDGGSLDYLAKMQITTNIYVDKSYNLKEKPLQVIIEQAGVPIIDVIVRQNEEGKYVISYDGENSSDYYYCTFKLDEDYDPESIHSRYVITFNDVDPDLFNSDHRKKITLNLVTQDEENKPKIKTSDLNLRIFDFKFIDKPAQIFTGDKIKFTLGENIPLLGDTDFEIDLGEVLEDGGLDDFTPPIYMFYKGDRMVLSFNCNGLSLKSLIDKDKGNSSVYDPSSKSMRNDNSSYSDFGQVKNAIKEMMASNKGQSLKDRHHLLEKSSSHRLKLNIYGGLEFGIMPYKEDGALAPRLVDGYVTGYITYEFEVQRTWVVLYVPITLIVNFDAEGRVSIDLVADDQFSEKDSIFDKHPLEIQLRFNIRISGGVGCSLASVGIYGQAGLDMLFTIGNSTKPDHILLNLDVGLYVRVKLGFIKLSAHKSLWSDTIKIYAEKPNEDGSYRYRRVNKYGEEESYQTLRGALNAQLLEYDGSWTASDGEEYNMYYSESQVVTYNGETYKFYVDDVNGYYYNKVNKPSTGYNTLNYLKIVYQKLIVDGEGNHSWSDPIIVNKDINNELEFDIVVDSKGIHIAYTRVKGEITDDGSINPSNVCDNLELKVITLSQINSFVPKVETTIDSQTGKYMFGANLENLDGTLYLTWIENKENSIFGIGTTYKKDENGNDTEELELTDKNVLYFTNLNDNKIHAIDGLSPIINTNLSIRNDKPTLIYVLEQENEEGEKFKSVNITLLDGSSNITFTTFTTLDKDENGNDIDVEILLSDIYEIIKINQQYYLYDSTSIYKITFDDGNGTISVEEFVNNVENIFEFIVIDGEIRGIIYVVNKENSDGVTSSSNLYYVLNNGNSFSNPIKVTNLDTNYHIENFAYYVYNDELFVTYTYYKENVTYDIVKDENDQNVVTNENHTILGYYKATSTLSKDNDIVLQDVIFEYSDIKPNQPFTIVTELLNDSLETIENVTIELVFNGEVIQTVEVTTNILPGELSLVEAKFDLTEINENYEIRISTNLLENDTTNNSKQVKLGYSDLVLNTKYVTIGHVEYILVFMQNAGNIESNAGSIYVTLGSVSPFVSDSNEIIDPLYELSYDAIPALEYKYYTIEINKVYFTDTIISVYAKDENSTDYDYFNNISYITITPNNTDSSFGYHSLVYLVDGEVYKTYSYETGDKIIKEDIPTKDGYKFNGWYNLPSTMPDYDVTVYGSFEKINYTVTYVTDEGTQFTDQYTYEDKIELRDGVEKEGYTFTGWTFEGSYDIPTTMPSENIILTATYRINTYKLLYYVNNESYAEQKFNYGTEISKDMLLIYPKKEGYTFTGWKDFPNKMPANDVNIYGIENINFHKVTYYINGKKDKEVTYNYNESIDLSYKDETGYSFVWKDENNNEIKNSYLMPDKDIKIYGEYLVNTYKLKYLINNETITFEYKYNDVIQVLDYKLDGYDVVWMNLPNKMPAKDIEVYGYVNKQKFQLCYILPDNKVITEAKEVGTTVDLLSAPQVKGYTFVGWEDSLGNIIEEKFIMPSNDVNLTAKYNLNKYTIKYYVDNDEIDEYTTELYYGDPIPVIDHTVIGHKLSKWTGLPNDMIMPDYDLNIYAVSTKNAYTIRYYVDYEEVNSFSILFGDTIPEFIYEKEGAIVGKWNGLPSDMKMPDNDLQITAVSNMIEYNLVYKVNGKVEKSEKLYFGETINEFIYDYPTEYMTFTGFGEVPDTMPSHNLEFNGYTENITFNVIYKVDGEEVYRDPYYYNDIIIIRQPENKLHYDFSGWSQAPQKMPANDVIVEGTFEKHLYTLTYVVNNSIVNVIQLPYEAVIENYNIELQIGEEFLGWKDLPITMPGYDVTVYGAKQNIKYNINYYVGDNTNPYLVMYYTVNDNVKLLNSIDCEGIFEGWYTNADFTGESISEIQVGTTGVVNLYAKVTPKKFINEDNVAVLIITASSGIALCGCSLFLGLKFGKKKKSFRKKGF